jgi:hypothetical protein
LNIPLAIITDTAKQGRKDYRTRYILVRPDHFISWAGDDPDGAEFAILSRAIGTSGEL